MAIPHPQKNAEKWWLAMNSMILNDSSSHMILWFYCLPYTSSPHKIREAIPLHPNTCLAKSSLTPGPSCLALPSRWPVSGFEYRGFSLLFDFKILVSCLTLSSDFHSGAAGWLVDSVPLFGSFQLLAVYKAFETHIFMLFSFFGCLYAEVPWSGSCCLHWQEGICAALTPSFRSSFLTKRSLSSLSTAPAVLHWWNCGWETQLKLVLSSSSVWFTTRPHQSRCWHVSGVWGQRLLNLLLRGGNLCKMVHEDVCPDGAHWEITFSFLLPWQCHSVDHIPGPVLLMATKCYFF